MINTKYTQKKLDVLTGKWERGMVLEKRDFQPETGMILYEASGFCHCATMEDRSK